MALPTLSVSTVMCMIGRIGHTQIAGQQMLVAPDAIVLYHFPSGFVNEYNLWFKPQCKHIRMPRPVFCLEIIMVEDIVVRNMTIVARGTFAMAAMVPGSILRRHNMAVDTCLGCIAQVRMRFRYLKNEQAQANDNAQ
jgi:hypothetical protein